MDREKLFAELCATAPDMPSNWAPEGQSRMERPGKLGLEAVASLYKQANGLDIRGSLGDERAEIFSLHRWYEELRFRQCEKFLPAWRVVYARSVLNALEDTDVHPK